MEKKQPAVPPENGMSSSELPDFGAAWGLAPPPPGGSESWWAGGAALRRHRRLEERAQRHNRPHRRQHAGCGRPSRCRVKLLGHNFEAGALLAFIGPRIAGMVRPSMKIRDPHCLKVTACSTISATVCPRQRSCATRGAIQAVSQFLYFIVEYRLATGEICASAVGPPRHGAGCSAWVCVL